MSTRFVHHYPAHAWSIAPKLYYSTGKCSRFVAFFSAVTRPTLFDPNVGRCREAGEENKILFFFFLFNSDKYFITFVPWYDYSIIIIIITTKLIGLLLQNPMRRHVTLVIVGHPRRGTVVRSPRGTSCTHATARADCYKFNRIFA